MGINTATGDFGSARVPILYSYILKKLIVRFAVLAALFVGVYSTIDYVETASNSGADRLYLVYGYKLPEMISHLLPLVLAMAILLTVADCRRKGEWVALQMIGISPHRLMGILMAVPLLLVPLAYFVVHQWAPLAMMQFEKSVNHEGTKPLTQYLDRNRIVSDGADGSVTIVERDASGRAIQLQILEKASGRPKHVWRKENKDRITGTRDRDFGAETQSDKRVPQYGTNGIFAASVPTASLLKMARDLDTHGAGTGAILTTVALRHSIVLAVWVVPFVALLLFSSRQRFNAMFAAVSMSVASAAGYWALLMLSWAWTTSLKWPFGLIPLFCVLGMMASGGAVAFYLKTLR